MSSMEVNVDMLEQMDLMDVSDQEALDVFLNSGGEENSAASPVMGSDQDSPPSEITLQVPTQAELRHKLSSVSSACSDSASQGSSPGASQGSSQGSGDSPLVQSDEEEVQVDTALAVLPETEPLKNSDDSDSQAT